MSGIIDDFYINIRKIIVVHKSVIDNRHICDYSSGRNSHGLIYALEGSAVYHFEDGSERTVSAGECVFLAEKSRYKIKSCGSFVHYTANFTADCNDTFGKSAERLLNSEKIISVCGEENHILKSLFSKLCKCWSEKSPGYNMEAVSILYQLLFEFIITDLKRREDIFSYNKILPAKEYIDKNWSQAISGKTLARLCNMSYTSFRRNFLAATGKTPHSYKDSILILHAKDFLAGEVYNISECADKCGFDDVNYFCRFFKKHTHMTPSEYKKHNNLFDK